MIEQMADMPPGTLGIRVWGEVTGADYTDVLMPALRRAVDEPGGVRLVFEAGPDVHFTSSALGADLTKGLPFGVEHWKAWKRMAVVTDVDWLRHAMRALGWMTPGEARLFSTGHLEDAKAWVAGTGDG